MEEIRSFETVIWSEPDEKHRVRPVDTVNSKELFTELENHLTSKGLLPDEYFLLETKYESNDSKMPKDYEALCIPNYGSSEGIYIDIYLIHYENSKKCTDRFICGKTLDESADGPCQDDCVNIQNYKSQPTPQRMSSLPRTRLRLG